MVGDGLKDPVFNYRHSREAMQDIILYLIEEIARIRAYFTVANKMNEAVIPDIAQAILDNYQQSLSIEDIQLFGRSVRAGFVRFDGTQRMDYEPTMHQIDGEKIMRWMKTYLEAKEAHREAVMRHEEETANVLGMDFEEAMKGVFAAYERIERKGVSINKPVDPFEKQKSKLNQNYLKEEAFKEDPLTKMKMEIDAAWPEMDQDRKEKVLTLSASNPDLETYVKFKLEEDGRQESI